MRPPSDLLRLAAAALFGPLLAACSEPPVEKPPPVRPVKVLEIENAAAGIPYDYPGKVAAARQADVAFEVAGVVIEFPVDEGQDVVEGTLLARLDARDYQNALASQRAERDRARAFLNRVLEAGKSGAVSQQEITDARARFDQAQAEVNIRKKAVSDTELRAPFTGRVARKLVDDFQNVQAKEPVVTIQDLSHLELVVSVPEADLALGEGDSSPEEATRRLSPEVVVSAFPSLRIPARLTEFSTTADPSTRTFTGTLTFQAPERASIYPGMTARAILTFRSDEPSGVNLPARVVRTDESGEPFVWLIEPETLRARRRVVEIGELSGSSLAVHAGLRQGDWVAVSGVHQLREGMEVRRLEE